MKPTNNLEESPNYRKRCVYDDASLSNDEQEVVKFNLPPNIVPETPHPEHADEHRNTCQTVQEQFRD